MCGNWLENMTDRRRMVWLHICVIALLGVATSMPLSQIPKSLAEDKPRWSSDDSQPQKYAPVPSYMRSREAHEARHRKNKTETQGVDATTSTHQSTPVADEAHSRQKTSTPSVTSVGQVNGMPTSTNLATSSTTSQLLPTTSQLLPTTSTKATTTAKQGTTEPSTTSSNLQKTTTKQVNLPKTTTLAHSTTTSSYSYSATELLKNYGGKIMPTVVTKNIFWGTSWASYVGDKMTGMDTFCNGYSNTPYAKTASEYSSSNGQVGSTLTHQGHVVDTTAAKGGSSTTAILNEVCKMIPNPDPSGNGFYSVFTDLPRGSAQYCAYHSYGTCNGIQVQFGFFWKLDGDSGCDPQSTVTGQSQGLQAIANVYAHELEEARTDPSLNAWLDAAGEEIGDKCAWSFRSPYVTFSDGTHWKVQSEWSNNAYIAGTGYPNTEGEKACIDGN